MKRIVIICEGETEQEFCNKILSSHFAQKGIYIDAPLIKHTNGGIVKWPILKKQIENTLKSEPQAYVTLMIDYYGLYKKDEFPGWESAMSIVNKNERISYVERLMTLDIEEDIRYRFLANIQLHEFEGLLFSDSTVFPQIIPEEDLIGISELNNTITEFQNPEMINTTKENSPSHRLLRIIRGYNKVVYGNIIAESIGLNTIRTKCPRFNNWLTRLEKVN